MCMSCDTGAIAKCTHPTGHRPVLQPEQHAALESPLKTAGNMLQSIANTCSCGHPQCWSNIARAGLAAMEEAATRPGNKATAFIAYDPELLEVGRVAALRIKAGRSSPDDHRVLADAFEEISRALPQGE